MAAERTYGLIVETTCPPHEVDATADRLREVLDCSLDMAGGRLLLTCYLPAAGAEEAAGRLLEALAERAPDLILLRLDDDLVAASDIAARLGITRQAVTQFAQPALGFPPPAGTCASARVWRWAEVNDWLRQHRPARADDEHWPTPDEATTINGMLLEHRRSSPGKSAPAGAPDFATVSSRSAADSLAVWKDAAPVPGSGSPLGGEPLHR